MKKGFVALLVAGLWLAVPASASAHGRGATIALDYRLVLHRSTTQLPGVSVSVLDGDRALRVRMARGSLTVRGDLGEPMLQLSATGALANRASATAVAEKLVRFGTGWQRLSSGSTFTWHEHRLSPPPYDGSQVGPVAAFAIPASLNGRPVVLGGSFIRYARPQVWPWAVVAVVTAAGLALVLRVRRGLRATFTIAYGLLAGFAALVTLVAFGAADAPNGNVAWAQIVGAVVVGAVVCTVFTRLHGKTRVQLAGLVGIAALFISLGWLSAFWHALVISALPATATRLILVIGLAAGAVSAVASFTGEETA